MNGRVSQGADPSRFNFNIRNWPIGMRVRYVGQRVPEHTGKIGTVVGYRPTNGLYVKFAHRTGSISHIMAERVTLVIPG